MDWPLVALVLAMFAIPAWALLRLRCQHRTTMYTLVGTQLALRCLKCDELLPL